MLISNNIFILLLLCLTVLGKTIQNLMNKYTSDRSGIYATSLSLRVIPPILCIPLLLWKNSLVIPNKKIILLSLLTGFLIGVSTIILVNSYKNGEVSLITPFYSLTPLFGGIFSWFLLSQSIKTLGVVGLLTISVGMYIIGIENFSNLIRPIVRIKENKSILYMISYTFIIGLVAPFDSYGVSKVDPLLWLFLTYTFSSLIILIFWSKSNNILDTIKKYDKKTYLTLFLIGSSTFISVFSTFLLYRYIKVAYVLAIFMLNIPLTSIFGIIIYREKIYLNKILAIILMTLGGIIVVLTMNL